MLFTLEQVWYVLILTDIYLSIFFLDPDPPSDLQVLGKEEHTIYFSWKVPRGGFDAFQVR